MILDLSQGVCHSIEISVFLSNLLSFFLKLSFIFRELRVDQGGRKLARASNNINIKPSTKRSERTELRRIEDGVKNDAG